jgi:hypothetical protein
VAAAAISIVTLHRMPPGPAGEPPSAPRDLRPLITTLDRLHLDRVYANYWAAYVLTFDTRERIIAVENKFAPARFVDGQAVPADDPYVKYPPYQREVKAARHGFVFFREGVESIPIVKQLERHRYSRYLVGPFVVFAPPADPA